MRILIETDGYADGTRIWVNDEHLTNTESGKPKLKFFEFSVNSDRSGKAKLIMQKYADGKWQHQELYAESFKKADEAQKLQEDGNVIGKGRS